MAMRYGYEKSNSDCERFSVRMRGGTTMGWQRRGGLKTRHLSLQKRNYLGTLRGGQGRKQG